MTRARNRLAESTERRIIKAVEAGILSQYEIAREMGIPSRAVQRCVARYRKAHPEWTFPGRRSPRLR